MLEQWKIDGLDLLLSSHHPSPSPQVQGPPVMLALLSMSADNSLSAGCTGSRLPFEWLY